MLASLRRLFAVCLISVAFVRPAAAADWTDIWWNPSESGWGVNFINSANFIFATFFVYGPNNQPFWYTGQMTVQSNGTWTGPVYLTTGTYFGNPWNTANDSATQVGTVTFTPSSAVAGTFTYNINDVNVSKQIQRQTLTTIPLGGNYAGAILSTFSNCNDSSQNGSVTVYVSYTVTQSSTNNTLSIALKDPSTGNTSCTFSGSYAQNGLLYTIPNAAYTCGSLQLTAQVTQVKATAQGFEGQWLSNVGSVQAGCIETGYWSGVFVD